MLRKRDEASLVENTPDLFVREYFTREDSEKCGLAIAELDGEYGININKQCWQIFYVIEGKITVELDGQESHLQTEDAIMIPANTEYWVQGKARFAVISAPAWYADQYELKPHSGT